MGFLIPMYMAGLAALSLPLLMHLVRRTPRGRQEFSSLMFLSPTVPRLTRRSRLDQLLLLLLRLLALACMVVAFCRPFFREASLLSLSDLAGRRVAILIDTSASMRRGDLWQQAVSQAEQVLDELNPQDDVALYTYSHRLKAIVSFTKDETEAADDKPEIVREALRKLTPDWNSTNLGNALVAVAGELDETNDVNQSSLEPQIVVISDFQRGSQIAALQSFEWPSSIPVATRTVTLTQTTNARAYVLPSEAGDELTDVRVRVVNAMDSQRDQFFLSWQGEKPATNAPTETPVYVPAGQSRVVRLPRSVDDFAADRIVLRGDDQDFDNTFYVVPPLKQAATVLYLGADQYEAGKSDNPKGIQYFLRSAVANDPLRDVAVRQVAEHQQLFLASELPPSLVVVSQALSTKRQASLKAYVERGGTLLLVPENRQAAALIPAFLNDSQLMESLPDIEVRENSAKKYLLLGEIVFTHPLFVPFANPRYSDFTKIHFWNHAKVALKTTETRVKSQVIARFDNGDPAILEHMLGKGRIIALTSGWQPSESQFALSSKFVSFVGALLDLACGGTEIAASVVVGESVTIKTDPEQGPVSVRGPGPQEPPLNVTKSDFTETGRPGIYTASTHPHETRFAVNLSVTESNTAPLDLEQLDQNGVRRGTEVTREERVERIRQQRDTELEVRQNIWRWLLVLAIGTLILESFLAGRTERQGKAVAQSVRTS